jgi:hypothetical protein
MRKICLVRLAAAFLAVMLDGGLEAQTRNAIDSVVVEPGTYPDGAQQFPDRLGGTHKLRSKTFTAVTGENVVVACVPCFSAVLAFALYRDEVFALTGTGNLRRKRFIVRVNRQEKEVHDMFANPAFAEASQQLLSVPGCNWRAVPDSTSAIVNAITRGVCMAR